MWNTHSRKTGWEHHTWGGRGYGPRLFLVPLLALLGLFLLFSLLKWLWLPLLLVGLVFWVMPMFRRRWQDNPRREYFVHRAKYHFDTLRENLKREWRDFERYDHDQEDEEAESAPAPSHKAKRGSSDIEIV